MTYRQLLNLSLAPLFISLRRWWSTQLEQHYLMCADVERGRVLEHQQNVRYYQAKAVLARANRV